LAVATPLRAQNALVLAFQKCTDPARAPEDRIKACIVVTQAEGIGADEIAFAYIDLSDVYRQIGKDDLALDALNKAVTLEPNAWQAFADRGFVHLGRGEFDEALADYRRAVAIDPEKLHLFRTNANASYRTLQAGTTTDIESQAREQAEYGNFLAQLRANVAKAFIYRCNTRGMNRAFASALADCNQALELEPKDSAALMLRAVVESNEGAVQPALADCDAAMAAGDGKQPTWFYFRALLKQRLGDKAGADADMTAAKQLAPDIAREFAKSGLAIGD
jgi:tetratricopeptide (TPR) repeat protein